MLTSTQVSVYLGNGASELIAMGMNYFAFLPSLLNEATNPQAKNMGFFANPPGPRGVGRGKQVSVRFKDPERAALDEAAAQRGTTPANWLRSLGIVHLARRPQWNPAELDALRAQASSTSAGA